MQNKLANPYHNLTVLRHADMFFGRGTLLRRLYSGMANQQCISLVGPRRIGKSSVLTCMLLPEIQKQFECDLDKHLFVSLDLRKYRKQTSEFFFEAVSKQIIAQCQERLELTLGSRKGGTRLTLSLNRLRIKGISLCW